ncbi:MAG: hypothetical protein R2932_33780 [Caldilineaceae bacterium]
MVYQHNQLEPSPGAAPLTLLYDDMEDGYANWTADAAWRKVDLAGPNRAWSDHPTLSYENNLNDSLTSVAVSLEALTNAALSFRTKHVLQNTDFGYVEISNDNGQSWTTIATFTGNSNGWQTQNIGIAAYSGQPRVQVRFRLSTDASGTAEGWYIDDVMIVEASELQDRPPPHCAGNQYTGTDSNADRNTLTDLNSDCNRNTATNGHASGDRHTNPVDPPTATPTPQ